MSDYFTTENKVGLQWHLKPFLPRLNFAAQLEGKSAVEDDKQIYMPPTAASLLIFRKFLVRKCGMHRRES